MLLKADTVTKDYVKDAGVFADIFNYYIYGGRQVILPEQLSERDSTKIALPYGADGALVPVQKFRDVQKLKQEKGQEGTSAGEYRKTPSTGEFLSGFWSDDRLVPSITVTIFFGPEEWDGPLSLFDMMDVSDPDVFACIDNYHVRLIAPAQMVDEEIMKFQSSLREVMLFIKYSKDRENLSRILKANEKRFREVERRAADVIEAITNSGIKYNESEAKIDMCQAIQEIRMDERKIGEQDGELKKAKEAAVELYKMGLDTEKIAQAVGYAVETVKGWLRLE